MIMFNNNVLPYALGLGIIAICIVFGSTDDKKYMVVFTSITIKYIDKNHFKSAEANLTEVDPDNPDNVGANVAFSLIKELSAEYDLEITIHEFMENIQQWKQSDLEPKGHCEWFRANQPISNMLFGKSNVPFATSCPWPIGDYGMPNVTVDEEVFPPLLGKQYKVIIKLCNGSCLTKKNIIVLLVVEADKV